MVVVVVVDMVVVVLLVEGREKVFRESLMICFGAFKAG